MLFYFRHKGVIVGIVVRNQVPMYIGFDEADVNFICEILADSLDRSYKIIDFFTERDEDWEDE